MSVHYKFKSALEYDTVTFDGLHISVKDLKNAIVQQKRIGKSTDFDLQVTNAQTKEVYDDDKALIPKNTSLLIARIPTTSQTKNKQWEGYGGDNTPPTKLDEGGPIAKAVDLSSLDAPEDDKIKAMMSQSTQDYDPSNYTKIRGANQMGPVPPNYRCYKCHQTGHWIKDCPLSKGPEPIEIKKSTGIPLSFMVPVEGPQVQGAMMTPNGSYAVPVLDHQTYTQKPSAPAPVPETKPEIPEELLCSICSDLLTDTVMIPCCGNSFCDECIRSHLLESEDHECPDCHEKEVYPGTLIPNRHLRSRVAKFKNTTGYVKKPVYRPSLVKAVEEIDIRDSSAAPQPPTNQDEAGDEPNSNAETEKTVISEADSTEHPKVEEKEKVKAEAKVKTDPETNEGPPGVSPAESPKVTISKRSTTSTRERSTRESSSRTHKSREHRSSREDSPRRHRNHRSSPFLEQGRNEERPGTPTIDEPGPRGGSSSNNSHSHHGSSDVRPPYSSGPMPPLIGTGPPMQGPPPSQMNSNYSSQPPMGAYHPPANGPPPNFRLPPPGGPMPPYMAPGPYQVPPRPIYDSARPPMSGPPPMYNPNYAPGSRTHHSRDYPVGDRRMRGRTPSGVIDDPLAAFNRMLREKDERERRAKRIQRRSYSRSRSRSRSYSRSPRRLRSRSPRRRLSRSRSRSFSLSRSRSRSFSGSVRGSPFRDYSPRHSPRPRRGPSRYRSPVRSPPRHRFKDHQSERFRDRDYERDHDHDRDREREHHRDRDRERDRDYLREERAYSRDRDHIREHRIGRDDREREERSRGGGGGGGGGAAGADREHHHRGERDARHDRDKRDRDSYTFFEGGYGEDVGNRGGGIRGKPPPHQWSGAPGMPQVARGPAHPEAGYFPPPLEIHGGHPPHPYAAPPNRYPPRDYVPPQFKNEPPHLMAQPPQMPPHLLPPSQRPRFEDIAPPGVEEPPIPGLEPPEQRFEDRFERFPPSKELIEKHEEEVKEKEEKKEKERVEKKEERKRKHRSRSREKSSRRSPSEVSRKKSKSVSPEKRSSAKRKKREPSSDGERDKKVSHSDEEKAPKKNKERKKKKEKKDSDKKKRKDKKSKHRKDEKEPKEKKHKEEAKEEPEKEHVAFEETAEEQELPPPTPEPRVEFEEEIPKLQLYDDEDDIGAMPKAVALAEKEPSIERTPEKLVEEPEIEPEDIPEEGRTPQKDYEDSEKDILEIHTTDIDLKAELEKNEMLAHMPEKSKWEVEEDVSSQTSPRDSGKFEKTDKSGKVTNEVLKRAENAIFAKAINAIRPIEIKKISTDRAKLYSGEKEEGEHYDEVEIRSVQIEEKQDRKKVEPPVRLSVKERLGVKIDDSEKPVKVDVARKKSRSLSPFSRRTNEAARNYGVGERRVEVVDRKRYDDRRRSRERRRDRRESRDSRKESYRRRDRDENRRDSDRKERKDRSKSKHRDEEKEPPKRASRVAKSPSEERKEKRKKKEKRTKKEKLKKHPDDKDEAKTEEVKPKIEKRKPTIDEASFEPDYDLESESEKEDSKEKSRKSEDKKSETTSSDSSESSSDEVRKKKKHRKHKKKPREETSSSSSESESDSSDDEKERKKRKHKKKQKKKKKSKHK